MARHRGHSIEFQAPVVAKYTAGETLHALDKRHGISRNLIRIWITTAEAGAPDDEAEAADLLSEFAATIAALGPLVGRQALELKHPKKLSSTDDRAETRLCPSSPAVGLSTVGDAG